MTQPDIPHQIAAIISRFFSVQADSISRETVASEIEGWDSLQHVYLIMEIENAFSLRLPTQLVFGLKNVGDLCDLIQTTLEP